MSRSLATTIALLMGAAALRVLVFGPRLLSGGDTAAERDPAPDLHARPVVTEAVAFRPRRQRLEAVGTARARQSIAVYPA